MNVLSLFSGIGGLKLGLERAGMTTVGQVEIDPFCRRVLAKHWPEVPRHDDVRTAVEWWQSEDRPRVDVICGGFPCQDISNAGLREGIEGQRSGLWVKLRDTVRHVRPRYVVLENVAAILARGLDVVAGDLAEIGYDLEWDCVPAEAVGAPHQRDRWWGIAYPQRQQLRLEPVTESRRGGQAFARSNGSHGPVAHSDRIGWHGWSGPLGSTRWPEPADGGWWSTEPDVGRVVDGLSRRVDGRRPRLKALGNAVVPQVAEHVGRLLVAAEARSVA